MGLSDKINNEKQVAAHGAELFFQVIQEQGVVIHFLGKVCELGAMDDIAREIILAVEQFGLKAVVQLRDGATDKTLGLQKVLEVEEKLLTHLSLTNERFIEFSEHLIVNFEHVSLLVKNITSLEDSKGSVKDSLNIMMKTVDARMSLLKENERVENLREVTIQSLFHNMKAMVDQVEVEFNKRNETTHAIMKRMIKTLDESLMGLGLDEDQERFIHKIAEDAELSLYSAIDSHKDLVNISEKITRELKSLAR